MSRYTSDTQREAFERGQQLQGVLAARITLHHSPCPEISPNPALAGALAPGGRLRQNQPSKRGAGGEGDCDFGKSEATPPQSVTS